MICGTLHRESYPGKCCQASVVAPIRRTEPATGGSLGKEPYCCLQRGSLVNTWREHAAPCFLLLDQVHVRNGSTEFLPSVRPQTKSQLKRTAVQSTPSLEPGRSSNVDALKAGGTVAAKERCCIQKGGTQAPPRLRLAFRVSPSYTGIWQKTPGGPIQSRSHREKEAKEPHGGANDGLGMPIPGPYYAHLLPLSTASGEHNGQ